MMRCNFFGRVGIAVRVFGLVVISVFYCTQSEATPPLTWQDLGAITGDLIINQSSPEIIEFTFTFRASAVPVAEKGHQASISLWYGDHVKLRELVADNTVTLSNGETFELVFGQGGFSGSFDTTGTDITFTIKFSKFEVNEWLQDSGKQLIFYPVIFSNNYRNYYYSKVTLDFLKEAYAHVVPPEDIKLPQEPSTDYKGFCVSSTTEKVRLGFQGVNSANAFQLSASPTDSKNSYKIDYYITLKGQKNDTPKERVINTPGFRGHKWDAHLANTSDLDCIGDSNMFLRVDFKEQQQADDAPPGTYKDTITITVSPAS